MLGKGWLPLAAAALLTGCAALGPDYQRTDPAVPQQFGSLEPAAVSGDPLPAEGNGWWQAFRDPLLHSLIHRASDRNHDLRLAAARVRQARSLRGLASSGLYPEGEFSGTYQRFHSTEAGFVGGAATGGGAQGSGSRDGDLFQSGFDASWEIDIFGGVRREIEAADADLEASQEAWRDTLVSLQGEVARNYFEIRAFQRRLEIAEADLRARREHVTLTQIRFQAGLVSELDLSRSRGALANAEAFPPTLERSLRGALHRIGVLLGGIPRVWWRN